jgi:hypothetical protein
MTDRRPTSSFIRWFVPRLGREAANSLNHFDEAATGVKPWRWRWHEQCLALGKDWIQYYGCKPDCTSMEYYGAFWHLESEDFFKAILFRKLSMTELKKSQTECISEAVRS